VALWPLAYCHIHKIFLLEEPSHQVRVLDLALVFALFAFIQDLINTVLSVVGDVCFVDNEMLVLTSSIWRISRLSLNCGPA
jgi:hypothetical protein